MSYRLLLAANAPVFELENYVNDLCKHIHIALEKAYCLTDFDEAFSKSTKLLSTTNPDLFNVFDLISFHEEGEKVSIPFSKESTEAQREQCIPLGYIRIQDKKTDQILTTMLFTKSGHVFYINNEGVTVAVYSYEGNSFLMPHRFSDILKEYNKAASSALEAYLNLDFSFPDDIVFDVSPMEELFTIYKHKETDTYFALHAKHPELTMYHFGNVHPANIDANIVDKVTVNFSELYKLKELMVNIVKGKQ